MVTLIRTVILVDSITLPEFWVWKLTESGSAEIARKVGNLPEFWVWKLPEIKASFFAAALKKQGIFSCYCKALSPICCSYKCCSACYIDSIQKLSLLQLRITKKYMTLSIYRKLPKLRRSRYEDALI